ncbi:MAG: hypothetical protein Q7R45_01855 [Sulfuricaulis sp.]|nr:hypothetical protein [Sulfuricaulis sp.]
MSLKSVFLWSLAHYLCDPAIHRSRGSRLSFWDALIVQAAIEGHASTLYSEDMQHGLTVDGLKVVNPFLVR